MARLPCRVAEVCNRSPSPLLVWPANHGNQWGRFIPGCLCHPGIQPRIDIEGRGSMSRKIRVHPCLSVAASGRPLFADLEAHPGGCSGNHHNQGLYDGTAMWRELGRDPDIQSVGDGRQGSGQHLVFTTGLGYEGLV